MSVLAVLALHAGHVLAQWFDYPREVYIRDTYNLSWDLSNDKGADEPWDFYLAEWNDESHMILAVCLDVPTSGTYIWTVPNILSTEDSRDIRLYARDASGSQYFYTDSITIKIHDSAATSDSSSLTPVGTPMVADSSSSNTSPTDTSDSTTTALVDIPAEVSDAPTSATFQLSSITSHTTDTHPSSNPTTSAADDATPTPDGPSTFPTMSTSALAGTVVSCFLVFSSLLTLTLTWMHRRGRRKRLNAADSTTEADVVSQPEIAELYSPSTPPSWGVGSKGVLNGEPTLSVPSSAVTSGQGMGGSPLSPSDGEGRGWDRGAMAVHELSADGAVGEFEGGGREMAEHGAQSVGMDEADSQAGAVGEVGVARVVWVGARRTA